MSLPSSNKFSRYHPDEERRSAQATDNQLDPVIGRDQELERVIEILCSRDNKNPILIGERGAGKTAIVEGLAQRIADGDVPSFLAEKRILAFDVQRIIGGTKGREKSWRNH